MRPVFWPSSPKLDLLSRFCTLLFCKVGNLSSPLTPLQREIDICVHSLFCTKFNFEQLLSKAFFNATCIFGSVEPQTGHTFPFLYIILQRWESFEPPNSTLRGDRHMCSRTFLYEILFRTTFIWSFSWCDAYFWQRQALKWINFPIFVHIIIVLLLQHWSQWCHDNTSTGFPCLFTSEWAHLSFYTPWLLTVSDISMLGFLA